MKRINNLRIVNLRGFYYPEHKTFCGWKRLFDQPTFHMSCVISSTEGIGFIDSETAQEWLLKWVKWNTPVHHKVDIKNH